MAKIIPNIIGKSNKNAYLFVHIYIQSVPALIVKRVRREDTGHIRSGKYKKKVNASHIHKLLEELWSQIFPSQ